jgi:methionyl-tRNA formyltransferase
MSKNKIKTIFFGTPRFAEIVLEKIIADGSYEILGVVTTPDEPVGRKQILTAPMAKVLAEKNGLKVWQPERLDDGFYEELKNYNHPDPTAVGSPLLRKEGIAKTNIDLFIVAAYGKIIPENFLNLPKFGCLNIHPSLLPKYRGASPIQSALLSGEKETGVTIMKMDAEMDHGPIVSGIKYQVSKTDTTEILMEKLASVGAELLLKTIPDYLAGKIELKEQDHGAATFCKIIKKGDGEIDWSKPAEEIYNQWRAFWPWPGVFANIKTLKHENIKTKFIELFLTHESDEKRVTGELFTENGKLFVAGGDNQLLEIIKLQPEGKNVLEAREFINGYLK